MFVSDALVSLFFFAELIDFLLFVRDFFGQGSARVQTQTHDNGICPSELGF